MHARRSAAARSESAFRRGNAMSGAPSISGTTKFARPANAGMMKRKIISVACTDTRPLNVCVSTNCIPGCASSARKNIAMKPADDEEEERRDEVLDPDHLVVGVDPEVVRPAVGAVARVVLGERRPAGDPVEPVVERADPGEEADRRRHHPADQDDVLPLVDRVPARDPAERDDDVHPDQEEQRCAPERADVAGPHEDAPAARARLPVRSLVLVLFDRGRHLASFPLRYATSASSSSGDRVSPKVGGITPGWYPAATTAFGSTID